MGIIERYMEREITWEDVTRLEVTLLLDSGVL